MRLINWSITAALVTGKVNDNMLPYKDVSGLLSASYWPWTGGWIFYQITSQPQSIPAFWQYQVILLGDTNAGVGIMSQARFPALRTQCKVLCQQRNATHAMHGLHKQRKVQNMPHERNRTFLFDTSHITWQIPAISLATSCISWDRCTAHVAFLA